MNLLNPNILGIIRKNLSSFPDMQCLFILSQKAYKVFHRITVESSSIYYSSCRSSFQQRCRNHSRIQILSLHIHCYEANRENIARLRQKLDSFAPHKIEIHESALWNSSGRPVFLNSIRLSLYNIPLSSSISIL